MLIPPVVYGYGRSLRASSNCVRLWAVRISECLTGPPYPYLWTTAPPDVSALLFKRLQPNVGGGQNVTSVVAFGLGSSVGIDASISASHSGSGPRPGQHLEKATRGKRSAFLFLSRGKTRRRHRIWPTSTRQQMPSTTNSNGCSSLNGQCCWLVFRHNEDDSIRREILHSVRSGAARMAGNGRPWLSLTFAEVASSFRTTSAAMKTRTLMIELYPEKRCDPAAVFVLRRFSFRRNCAFRWLGRSIHWNYIMDPYLVDSSGRQLMSEVIPLAQSDCRICYVIVMWKMILVQPVRFVMIRSPL